MREERGRVVPPRAVPRELLDRERLNAVESQLADVAQLALDVRETRPRFVELVAAAGEAADVALINDEILEPRGSEGRPRERIGTEHDRTVADS